MFSIVGFLRSMTLSNLHWTSDATTVTTEGAGATGIEDAGEEIFAGTGEVEITGVGESTTTEVTK